MPLAIITIFSGQGGIIDGLNALIITGNEAHRIDAPPSTFFMYATNSFSNVTVFGVLAMLPSFFNDDSYSARIVEDHVLQSTSLYRVAFFFPIGNESPLCALD